jgi:hypothetical protein
MNASQRFAKTQLQSRAANMRTKARLELRADDGMQQMQRQRQPAWREIQK